MAVLTALAIASTAVAAGSTIIANKNANKAAKANQQAAALDRQRMNLQSARERRDAIKASRLAYATSQNAAVNQGVSGSSSSEGGLGSIASQLSSNVSFLDRYNTLTDMASQQIGYANKYASKARTAEAVGGLAQTVFNNSNTLADMWANKGS